MPLGREKIAGDFCFCPSPRHSYPTSIPFHCFALPFYFFCQRRYLTWIMFPNCSSRYFFLISIKRRGRRWWNPWLLLGYHCSTPNCTFQLSSHMARTQLISCPIKKGRAMQKHHYRAMYMLVCVRNLPKSQLTQICRSGFVGPFSSICRGEGSGGGLEQGWNKAKTQLFRYHFNSVAQISMDLGSKAAGTTAGLKERSTRANQGYESLPDLLTSSHTWNKSLNSAKK